MQIMAPFASDKVYLSQNFKDLGDDIPLETKQRRMSGGGSFKKSSDALPKQSSFRRQKEK